MRNLAEAFAGGDWAAWTGLPRMGVQIEETKRRNPWTTGEVCSVPRCLGCAAPGSWLCAACLRFTVQDCTAIAAAKARPRIESRRPLAPAMPSGEVQLTMGLGDGTHQGLRERYAAELHRASLRKGRRWNR